MYRFVTPFSPKLVKLGAVRQKCKKMEENEYTHNIGDNRTHNCSMPSPYQRNSESLHTTPNVNLFLKYHVTGVSQ